MGYFPHYFKFPWNIDPAEFDREPLCVPTEDELADKFEALLKSAKSEGEIHEFLEKYPHLLPGIETFHNGPMADLVLNKLPLGNDFITDFAFVSENSQNMQITFVEIESPQKRIFRKDGSFSREYLDARQQLADWNNWGQRNLRSVASLFGPMGKCLSGSLRYSDMTMQCFLVIGRRSELTTRKRQERWAAEHALSVVSMTVMTYDRLIERIRAGWIWSLKKRILVCNYCDREFRVKRIAIS